MHLLIFVNIYLSPLAVWYLSHSLDYKMIELTEMNQHLFNVFFTGFVKTWAYKQEMKLIAQIVTQFTYSQITEDISTATRRLWFLQRNLAIVHRW